MRQIQGKLVLLRVDGEFELASVRVIGVQPVYLCAICFLRKLVFEIIRFFYKNKLYKNTQAEISLKIKNKLRKIARLKF